MFSVHCKAAAYSGQPELSWQPCNAIHGTRPLSVREGAVCLHCASDHTGARRARCKISATLSPFDNWLYMTCFGACTLCTGLANQPSTPQCCSSTAQRWFGKRTSAHHYKTSVIAILLWCRAKRLDAWTDAQSNIHHTESLRLGGHTV